MNKNINKNELEQIDSMIKLITNTIYDLLKQKSQVVLAVSGGKSPIALFNKLNTIDIPWEKIIITLVDERVTNIDSLDSNENLVKTHLLQNQAIRARFNGLILPGQNIQKMLNIANSWAGQIDIAILGMGEDGHTASIFPNCPEFNQAVNKNNTPAYMETNPVTAKYTRISLNLSGLIRIPYLILNINSKVYDDIKLKVLDEALKGDNPNYPISYLLKQRPDINIF